ncbi:hypothetical protein ABZX77_42105 [Streptomyces sp. NPDC004237]|uniref:hypothetical protein n=1 Tax=Streptomyces sp. NPDC004237 TaxID=3154455 RepID=UPI0033B39968
MQFATVVAALAAAIGLIFTAWTGYWSVEVARDQLGQSREDADRELRQQAVLVSAWTQTDGSNAPHGEPGGITGFITNRSLDPVDQVVVGIGARKADEPISTSQRSSLKTLLYLGPLPPCSRVTISATAVKHALGGTDIDYTISGVSFVDVYGQRWARVSSGPLKPLEDLSSESSDPFNGNAESIWKALYRKKGISIVWTVPGAGNSELDAPKSLEDCGAEK